MGRIWLREEQERFGEEEGNALGYRPCPEGIRELKLGKEGHSIAEGF